MNQALNVNCTNIFASAVSKAVLKLNTCLHSNIKVLFFLVCACLQVFLKCVNWFYQYILPFIAKFIKGTVMWIGNSLALVDFISFFYYVDLRENENNKYYFVAYPRDHHFSFNILVPTTFARTFFFFFSFRAANRLIKYNCSKHARFLWLTVILESTS